MIVSQYLGHAGQAPFWRIGWTDMGLAPVHIMPGTLLDSSRKRAPVILQDQDVLPGFRIHCATRTSIVRQHAGEAQQQGFGG
jgi:hypothetical protein